MGTLIANLDDSRNLKMCNLSLAKIPEVILIKHFSLFGNDKRLRHLAACAARCLQEVCCLSLLPVRVETHRSITMLKSYFSAIGVRRLLTLFQQLQSADGLIFAAKRSARFLEIQPARTASALAEPQATAHLRASSSLFPSMILAR